MYVLQVKLKDGTETFLGYDGHGTEDLDKADCSFATEKEVHDVARLIVEPDESYAVREVVTTITLVPVQELKWIPVTQAQDSAKDVSTPTS